VSTPESLRAEVDRLTEQLRWYRRRVAALGALVGPQHQSGVILRRELERTAAYINYDGTWRGGVTG
jgi:hypothetical protein